MRDETFNISFIGAGNVASHLAPALENVGHSVKEVYSKTGASAKNLIKNLYDASLKDSLNFLDSTSNIFIISIPDDEIIPVLNEIELPDQSLLVHTSGALSMDIIPESIASVIGVFYPLQTFSKSRKLKIEEVPFLLESNHKSGLKILTSLAKSISKQVHHVNSQQRSQLHVAAVFACNFTNYLMTVSEELLDEAKLDFNLLGPLVAETIEKSLLLKPSNAQTGPAKRGDLKTLDKHMEMLAKHPAYSEIYKIISQQILDKYQ
jgi:predicted short-subunit dehydrogenase-like oxidoreductase (DUF2520 family)